MNLVLNEVYYLFIFLDVCILMLLFHFFFFWGVVGTVRRVILSLQHWHAFLLVAKSLSFLAG